MDGTNYATNEPHSLHFLDCLNSSSMDEESKSVNSRHDFCIGRVDRNQLHSFIENNTHDYLHSTVDHAFRTVRSRFDGLEVASLGSSSGKRKYNGNEGQGSVKESLKRVKVDYANRARPRTRGLDYVELAVTQLHKDFSYVEEGLIHAVFKSLGTCYAPTHLFLLTKQREVLKRLHLTTVPPVPNFAKSDKGKRRAPEDAEFDRERRWLLEVLSNQGNDAQYVSEGGIPHNQFEVADDDGRMIECGCCFTEHPPSGMASCPDRHMFCHGCISTQCSNLLLVQKSRIPCMSTEGCESFFSAYALRRALDKNQFVMWERLDQRREIAAAGLVLEDCPFCEFGCVISEDQVTVLVCGNTEKCGKVSCRRCKKLDHLPKTCQEVRDDEIREGRHAVAEAMSRALMRNCPKCDKPFIKDDGCNKITCPSCGTLSCYVCRKAIAGYDHFDSNHRIRRRGSNGMCPLFDAKTDRHNNDVIQAAAAALEQVKRDHPDVEQNELIKDLPQPRRKPAPRWPRRRIQGPWLRHPLLTNNQPNPDILQHAAPLLALAPQPIPPVDLMRDQPFVPQVGSMVEPPGPLGNIPLPMLQHQQYVPTQADVYQQLKIDMVPVLPQRAVAPKPSPPLHHFPPVPALPPPLLSPSRSEAPLHHLLHAPNYLNRPPISPADILGLCGPLMSPLPSPVQETDNVRRVNLLHPGVMLYPEQVPRQTIDGILPLHLSLSASQEHHQAPSIV